MADGSPIDPDAYARSVSRYRVRIAYVDLTFSADKSVSVAWAFAPTDAERAIVWQAHRDAVESALSYVAGELGRARRGKGGRGGVEHGDVGWIAFDHFASRPTVEIARTDALGRPYTELATLKVAGDPQLHTHVLIPNVVLTRSGRLGSMDLDRLEGRVHEFGAYYQAHVAQNLRRHGVEIVLDPATGAARIAGIPERIREAFSKRTKDATEAARAYARDHGEDWDALSPARKSALVKGRAGAARLSKSGEAGDEATWKRQAEALGWTHRSVLRPNDVNAPPERAERLEHAYQTALPLLDEALQRRARLDAQELRVIACRGLVDAGLDGPGDIDAVTRAFRQRRVREDGRETALIWGHDAPLRGKPRISVTTALHADQESKLIRLARTAAGDRTGALSRRQIDQAVTASGLDFTGAHGARQHEIVDELGCGGRFAVAIGVAGAGKSAILAPLVRAWQADGRRVYGAALAWRQTEDLHAAGIAPQDRAALSVFLRRVGCGDVQLDGKSVIVLDELGLVGPRDLLALLQSASGTDASSSPSVIPGSARRSTRDR